MREVLFYLVRETVQWGDGREVVKQAVGISGEGRPGQG